jgi:hypothetical protein
MANGYLGKISAVVSANTADFQGKLNAAAKDVQKFASSMQGSLSSAQSSAATSLRGIYTDAQKLERALTAISTRKLSFRGFGDKDLDTAVGRMRALYSATEQINKPLSDAAKGFGKLPAVIQGAFLPALISAQKASESLAGEINRTGKAGEDRFGAITAKVERTTAAMARLKEASSLVSGLATGKELAFQRPEMVSETRRSASLQADIGKLPPDAIRGYAELVTQQRAVAVETERLAAALEKVKLSRNGDTAAATAAYQSQLAAQKQLNDEIERRVGAEAAAKARAAAAADAEIAILQRRAQAGQAAERERLDQAQKAADAEIAILQRRAQAEQAAERERQAQEQKAFDNEVALLQRRAQAEQAAERERLTRSQKAADAEIAILQRRAQAEQAAERERQAQEQKAFDNEVALLQRRAQAEQAAERERLAPLTRDFTLQVAAPEQRREALFGSPAAQGIEQAAARARALSAEFDKLPEAAKRSLSGLAQIASRLAGDMQDGKTDATAFNQVLDRLEASISSLAAAERSRDAATQARQRVLQAEIAQNDRLITQERELEAARRAGLAATTQTQIGSLSSASAALLGPRQLQEQPIDDVFAGLSQQANAYRAAVEKAFGMPQFDELREQAKRAGAEIQSIEVEVRRLNSLDPQRDAEEYAEAWARIGRRVRQVNDLMVGGTRIAEQAAAIAPPAPPEPPEPVDRNADRIGAMSPMDRNAGNLGARTSLGAMGDRTDISDMGRMSSLEDRRRELARQAVGDDLELPRRQLASLASGITSLKSQIDGLPDGIRTRFVPAIRDAEAEFIRLSAAPNALPGAIDAARQRVQQLAAEANRATQAMNFSQSFGGGGLAGLNLGLDQRSLQGYTAQMQIIQSAIGRASAEARGPAVAAFDRLRAAVGNAFDEGRLDAAATREELARLRQQAVNAAAAVSGIRVGTLTRDVQRAGDVGRQGFDKFSLALNQGAFAIDDFMSSTGGLEFKLRAVSNNITQMAFVLGGTAGLFVGLGAVIAGQAAVALIKFMNSGRSAEDQTKALNDALARQKNLVDGLAESHKALADAILRGTMSSSSESERTIASGQANLRRQSAELSAEREAAADTAPLAPQSISKMIGEFYEPRQRRNEFQGVAELRAELNKLQKQLESATTVGERATIQGRIRETGRAELATRSRLAAGPTPDANAVQAAIFGSASSSEMASGGTFGDTLAPNDPARNRTSFGRVNSQRVFSDMITLGGATLLGINRTRRFQQDAANEGLRGLAAQAPTSVEGQIEALRKAQELKRPEQAQADLGFIRTSAAIDADREIAKFEAMIQSLQEAMERGIVDSASQTYAASVVAANSIRAAQEDVADAIKRGVPSALAFQSELNRLSSELAAADDDLRSAVTANPDDPNVTPERREAAIKRAQDRVDEVNRQREDVESRAREIRLGRTFGGDRTTRALSSLEGNDRFANEQAGLVARLKRAVDDEVQARRKASEAAGREAAIVDLIAKKRTEVENSGSDINKRKIAEADIKAAKADLEKATAAREAAAATSALAQKSSEAAAALAEAAAGIEAALTRIRKVGESALQRSEQGADAAQRAFEENPLRAGGVEAIDDAERRLIEDRARVGTAQAGLSDKRGEIRRSQFMRPVNLELEEINQRRQELEAKGRVGAGLTPAESAELGAARKREIELIKQREMITRNLTQAELSQLLAINNGIAARERELEKERQRATEEPAFRRQMAGANQIIADSERQANEAQERYINNPTERTRKERDEADARLREDRERAQGLQDDLERRRREMTADPEVVDNDLRIAENSARLAQLAEKEATTGLTEDEIEERDLLQRRNRERRADNEAIFARELRPEQKAIDDERIAQNQRDRALRGRDLGMTDRERFRRDFAEGAGADINARAKELRDKGEDPTKFLRQALSNQMKQVAPMLQGFQDERQNALLQGPSRAALNVSDVSTSQGQSELTRLLRGDDPAKDVNLAELRRQTDKLDEVVKAIKEANPEVLL